MVKHTPATLLELFARERTEFFISAKQLAWLRSVWREAVGAEYATAYAQPVRTVFTERRGSLDRLILNSPAMVAQIDEQHNGAARVTIHHQGA